MEKQEMKDERDENGTIGVVNNIMKVILEIKMQCFSRITDFKL